MGLKKYIYYNDSHYYRIGQVAIFLANSVSNLTKTKLLKFFYILDEFSIQRAGIPILNLTYKIWKYGPVSEEIFIDLSADDGNLGRLSPYLKKEGNYFVSVSEFDEDEFSEYELGLLNEVVEEFGLYSLNDLIDYTHREGGVWRKEAKKRGVLELLETNKMSNTDYVLPMQELLSSDPLKRGMYFEYLELF